MYERRAGRIANCRRAKADKERVRVTARKKRELVERRGDQRDKRNGNRACVGRRKRYRTTRRIKEEENVCERDRTISSLFRFVGVPAAIAHLSPSLFSRSRNSGPGIHPKLHCKVYHFARESSLLSMKTAGDSFFSILSILLK